MLERIPCRDNCLSKEMEERVLELGSCPLGTHGHVHGSAHVPVQAEVSAKGRKMGRNQ